MTSPFRAWEGARVVLSPSLRLVLRHKRFAALAVLSLGVAIALNTTMYSVLDTMISPKLAMRAPEQLFEVRFFGDRRGIISIEDRNSALLDGTTFHEGMAGARWSYDERIVERGNRVREASVLNVTPSYFAVLGVRAIAGRLLSARDLGEPTRPVVLGERMWRQLFPDQDSFEPLPLFIGGKAAVVVGLLPYEADFPGAYTDVWQLAPPGQISGMPLWIARIRPGVTMAQVNAELKTLTLRFAERTGERGRGTGFRLSSLTKPPFRPYRFHWALIGAVVGVMLIACANLANLQLARGVARTRELATRATVGATRGTIVKQLLAESAWLAAGGLALGGLLTAWGMRIVNTSVPPEINDYVTHAQLSWRVLAFAVLATLICLMLVGLVPAIRLSRVNIHELIKSGAGTGKSRSGRRQYGVLVVVEVALALALLSSASLLMSMAVEVRTFDLGHDYKGLVHAIAVVRPDSSHPAETRRAWSDRLIQEVLSIPGVIGAATEASRSPAHRAISVDDPGGAPIVYPTGMWGYNVVSPDYFRTMRIPMVKGRDFSPGEFAQPVAIIGEQTARCLFHGADPVGRLIKLDSAGGREPWLRIVGVAGRTQARFNADRPYKALLEHWCPSPGKTYINASVFVLNANDTTHLSGTYSDFIELVVRGPADPRRLPRQIYTGLAHLQPRVRAQYPLTWEQRSGITALRARHDFIAALFTIFALLATGLAALGVYAIIAHTVAQRTREFGVRIAVEAGAREIRELVMREGNILSLLGIAAGLLVTWQFAGLLRAFLFSDWDRYDSRMFAIAAVVLFVTAWLASYIPARRAMRIDPTEALRNE